MKKRKFLLDIYISSVHSWLTNRNTLLQGNCRGSAQIYAGTLGNASKSSWRPFEQYLKSVGDSLGNTQRVLEAFSAMLTEQWIHFGKCLNKSGDPMGAFPTRSPSNWKQGGPLSLLPTASPHISGGFCLFFWSKAVLLNLYTSWRHNKNLNAFSVSSPIFTLSNYINFGQTPTGATIALSGSEWWVIKNE